MHAGTIFAARKRIKWPGEAAVIVSVVHVNKGPLTGPFELDGRSVERITAFLFNAGGDEDPIVLGANEGIAFLGVNVVGPGFVFADDEEDGAGMTERALTLLEGDARYAPVLKPFIGGDELNDDPHVRHARYIVDFGVRSEAEARQFGPLMEIVESRVKPFRERQNDRAAKERWWQFARPRPELRSAIQRSLAGSCLLSSQQVPRDSFRLG